MISCLHDIRNRLAIISAHTSLLAKKYGEEDFIPIKSNVSRINVLINDAYERLQDSSNLNIQQIELNEFANQMHIILKGIEELFSSYKNDLIAPELTKLGSGKIEFNSSLMNQILENAIGNSVKANATKIHVRLFEFKDECIIEVVDNGSGFKDNDQFLETYSKIPHGLGTHVIMQNMKTLKGKTIWKERLDSKGVILRLVFSIIR